jgi:hypothetical protein
MLRLFPGTASREGKPPSPGNNAMKNTSEQRPTRAQLNTENARRYPAPPGSAENDLLLNVSAIAVDFSINYWTVFARQKRKCWPGCPTEALTAYSRTYTRTSDGKSATEDTFLKSDVENALKPLPKGIEENGPGHYRVNRDNHPEESRVTFQQACNDCGAMARETMKGFEEKGLIEFNAWESWTGLQGRYCTEEDLQALKAKLAEKATAQERDTPTGNQITIGAAATLLQPLWRKRYKNRRKLTRQRILHWHHKGCLYLCGYKISLEATGGQTTWCDKGDINLVAIALALPRGQYRKQVVDPDNPGKQKWITISGRTGVKAHQYRFDNARKENGLTLGRNGPGGIGLQGLPLDLAQSLENNLPEFNGVFPDGRVSLSKASDDSGLNRNFLKKSCIAKTPYLSNLKDRPDLQGTLPSVKQNPPAAKWHASSTRRQEHSVWMTDVMRLKASILEAEKVHPPAGCKDAAEICQLAKATNLEDKILVNFILKQGRDSGAIETWRCGKPIKHRGLKVRPQWFYKTDSALRYIREIDVVETGSDEDIAADESSADAKVRSASSLGGRPPNPMARARQKLVFEMRDERKPDGEFRFHYDEIRSKVKTDFGIELPDDKLNRDARRHAEREKLPFFPR